VPAPSAGTQPARGARGLLAFCVIAAVALLAHAPVWAWRGNAAGAVRRDRVDSCDGAVPLPQQVLWFALLALAVDLLVLVAAVAWLSPVRAWIAEAVRRPSTPVTLAAILLTLTVIPVVVDTTGLLGLIRTALPAAVCGPG
jgi:hypothetical protein